MVNLKRTDSHDPDFQILIAELDVNLREIYDQLMDIYDEHNVIEELDTVVVAYVDDEPAGCGCFKHFNEDAAELKRMFVRKNFRGQGISGLILAELETWAKERNHIVTVLETGEKNIEALGLYRKSGYSPMPNYGPYVNLRSSFCFRKRL
jgi:GNAT superfamily N-acetyltransferase